MLTTAQTHLEPSLAGLPVCNSHGTMNPEQESATTAKTDHRSVVRTTDSDVERTIDNLIESQVLLNLVLRSKFDPNICRARRHIMDALRELGYTDKSVGPEKVNA
jgi:hypothetical protein